MDDLLDLDFAAASSQGQGQAKARPFGAPVYGGGLGRPQGAGGPSGSFDAIAGLGAFTPSPGAGAAQNGVPSRTASPMYSVPGRAATTLSPMAAGIAARQTPVKQASGSDGDAFASLFGSSPTPSAAASSNLSMAERLARDRAAAGGSSAAGGSLGGWESLSPNSTASNSRVASPASFAPAGQTKPPAPAASAKAGSDPWDFDFLATQVPAKPSSSAAAPKYASSGDFFGLDDDLPPPAPAPATRSNGSGAGKQKQPHRRVLSGFEDFGGEEAAPIFGGDADSDGDDDILGALSQPARARPSPGPTPSAPSNGGGRSDSPPPHILGKIVEMGLPIGKGKQALVATRKADGSWDLERAVEVLMDEGEVDERPRRVREEPPRDRERPPREQERRRPRPTEQQDQPSRDRRQGSQREEPVAADTATELLATASKFGFSMLKSANAYIEAGRQTLQKAIDERAESPASGSAPRTAGGSRANGRPKWMVDAELAADAGDSPPKTRADRFVDSDNEDERPAPARPPPRDAPRRPPSQTQQRDDALRPAAPVEEAKYVSPWRKMKATAAAVSGDLLGGVSSSTPTPARTPTPSQQRARSPAPPPQRPPSPAPRPHVSVTPGQLSTSAAHKTKGNELFKLGQFGDAETWYGRGIDALPEGHLLLVPLYNNRAAARLKVGDEKRAIEDCVAVVGLVLGPANAQAGRPADDLSKLDISLLERELERLPHDLKEVNLRDQLAKAISKRARAFEASERWDKAAEDWSRVIGGGQAFATAGGGIKLVSESLSRCRRMASGGGKAAPAPARSNGASAARASRAPRPAPVAAKVQVPIKGGALERLRESNAVAEAEEEQRFALTDSVDARIVGWKGGKESNLRALIASLENVLWPELGWKKVGLHELVTDSQVKVKYVRAIAKVHPDKLNVNSTTVEQRMIAGAVFAALNEAWNASSTK